MGAEITSDRVESALQRAWNDFVQDTGCYPDCFEIKRGKITADFSVRPFAAIVASYLRLEFEEVVFQADPLPIRGEGWQEMETVPKDGSRVLLACLYESGSLKGQINCVSDAEARFDEDGNLWWDGLDGIMDQSSPCYWMHLPALPGAIETTQLPAAQETAGLRKAAVDVLVGVETVDDKSCRIESHLIDELERAVRRTSPEVSSETLVQARGNEVLVDRCRELEEVLTMLYGLKLHKELNGKDEFYLSRQPVAWNRARQALGIQPLKEKSDE